ncbi:MAG TPA: IgGFc-binding protein [Kofleriaceae bacterium]|nr:IgGFc-binding protein [Kofleriaceae bacterium]
MKATLLLCLAADLLAACGPSQHQSQHTDDSSGGPDMHECPRQCSDDQRSVLDCNGQRVVDCTAAEACDVSQAICTNACTAAEANHRSIGCDYYAVHMDSIQPNFCFAVFVANTWTSPAKIGVEYRGAPLSVASFARVPVGAGPGITYAPYDAATGIVPGQVAVLFLGGNSGDAPLCPVQTAVPTANRAGTGISDAFHITSDVPVVAYQINPYGGGAVAVTAASLLLPSSAWDTNYIAVNVSAQASGPPSLNIIAREDGTIATITPRVTVNGGNGIPVGAIGQPLKIPLSKGQHAQITQSAELTGSVITSNKPIGFMAGQVCMQMPVGTPFCDHGEQMIPPIRALAHRYVGVMYRPRIAAETSTFWRVVGAVDGTQLTWTSDVGGPATLSKGQSVVFQTGAPFVVSSQDRDHPFMLFTYMTSSQFTAGGDGYGDPDFVLTVPPEQYLKEYVFFADPTYPETNLVLVRTRGKDGQFHDVDLDCAGAVHDWRPVNPDYEFTRVDLSTGNFAPVGGCSTGRHEIRSDAPFGLWVWGWGTPLTSSPTKNVSYGYPGGMNVTPINDVIIN